MFIKETWRIQQFWQQQKGEFFLFILLIGLIVGKYYNRAERVTWSKDRSSDWWKWIVPQFTIDEWKGNFRLSSETFHYLCNELTPQLLRQDTQMRKALRVEQRVSVTLWRPATNAEYRTVAHWFGVARSTVCEIVDGVCAVIIRKLLRQYIAVPSGDNVSTIVWGFPDEWGFPQCARAIDGSHIPVQPPQDCLKEYYNCKGYHSVILQVLVDHRYCFIKKYSSTFCGGMGQVKNSHLYLRYGSSSEKTTAKWAKTLTDKRSLLYHC